MGSSKKEFEETNTYMYMFMAILCIFCAALAAGLTIGLVSMDRNALRLLLINGTDEEKRQVNKVLPLVRDRHWLLVTLFLFNATANEALPVFLTKLVPGFAAVLLSSFLVLIFGEIIPSSIFAGRRQLELAAKLSWVVRLLFVALFVVAKPIAMLLDYWIGKHEEHDVPFNAKDLYTLLSLSADDPHGMTTPLAPPKSSQNSPTANTYIGTNGNKNSLVLNFKTTAPHVGGVMNVLHCAEEGHMISLNACLENCSAEPVDASTRSSFESSTHSASSLLGDVEMKSVERSGSSEDSAHCSTHKAPSFLDGGDGQRILLDRNSVTIAQGAIVCSRKTVSSILIAPDLYTSLNADEIVSFDLLEKIGLTGHSRIIVYERRTVIGYIVAKELLCHLKTYLIVENRAPRRVRELPLSPVAYFEPAVTVLEALAQLKSGASRIAAVTIDGFSTSDIMGFFSLEDIIEAILQEEIEDEKDYAKFYVAKRATTNNLGPNSSVIGKTIGLF